MVGTKRKSGGVQDVALPRKAKGEKIHIQTNPFKLSSAEVIKASYGLPAWSRRLKRIEVWEARTAATLDRAWQAIKGTHHSQTKRLDALKAEIASIDLDEVNGLIANHNAYFPIEARLPIDSITGVSMYGAEPFQATPKVTHASLLEETCARLGLG